MKISKEQWQKWASEHAANEADDFARHNKLTIEAHIILKAKIEAAMLCGMEMAAKMHGEGYDIQYASDLKPRLLQTAEGDKTYTMKAMPEDGGGVRLVHETELPDYPMDGGKS